MADRPTPRSVVGPYLTGPDAAEVLGAALGAADLPLDAWRLDSVHHRVGRSLSALYAARVLDADDGAHDLALVAHVDRKPVPAGTGRGDRRRRVGVGVAVPERPVPAGAAVGDLGRAGPRAARRARASSRARSASRSAPTARRAAPSIEVAISGEAAEGRVLYLKVLAGDRAARLATVHRELAAAERPRAGRGRRRAPSRASSPSVRSRARRSAARSPRARRSRRPRRWSAVSERLAAAPLRPGADPTRFADPTRHVTVLAELCRTSPRRPRADRGRRPRGRWAARSGARRPARRAAAGARRRGGRGAGRRRRGDGVARAGRRVVGRPPRGDRRGLAGRGRARPRRTPPRSATAYARLLDPRDLARGAAGAWLGLATGPYRVQDAGWERFTRARIERAVAWADRAALTGSRTTHACPARRCVSAGTVLAGGAGWTRGRGVVGDQLSIEAR